MSDPIKTARAIGERADIALTPDERAERRRAGQLRKRAMEKTGATSYRSLVTRLNGGVEQVERRS